MAGIGLTVPVMLPLEIAAIVSVSIGMFVKLMRCKLQSKAQKHDAIRTIAESKLNSIKDFISKALQDGQISEQEFKMVLDELDKYNRMKQEIKEKKSEISQTERKKLIKQGREEAMTVIQKSMKNV